MIYKITAMLSIVACCECVHVYSSFWAPLADPAILNYRVDVTFEDSSNTARDLYERRYGYRGRKLIADLGNGERPGDESSDKVNRDIHFYYTYPGATNNGQQTINH